MKRRTFRKLRAERQPENHHNVYVVLLEPAAARLRAVRAANPRRDPKKPCVYVGMTGLDPEERFANHKQGIKAAPVVKTLWPAAAARIVRPPESDAVRGGGPDGAGFGGGLAPGGIHRHGRTLMANCHRLAVAFAARIPPL